MQATTFYEFERPEGWNGEIVDMDTYEGEVEYIELEVEGDVCIEIERNYGADADGNRGVEMDFSYVEDITIILDGDFRPFSRKVKDFFRGTLFGKTWGSFSDNSLFRFKSLGEEILMSAELTTIEEGLLECVEGFDESYEPGYKGDY